jgi:hypothetical protein
MRPLEFTHQSLPGQVEVDIAANDDPSSLGCHEAHRDFPVCTATIRYTGKGYQAMFGWVQLVQSTDAKTSGFEMDPYFLFPDIAVPYCFYGYRATLFDAPGRAHRDDMDWIAHSFLAVTPAPDHAARQVIPLQGFSWGFRVRRGAIYRALALPLAPYEWISHIAFLRATYPGWRFDSSPRWTSPANES